MSKLLQEYIRLLIKERGMAQGGQQRAPGMGFGTGISGNSSRKPAYGSLGGNHMRPHAKPYSDDFSDELIDDRAEAWEVAENQFSDAIENLIAKAEQADDINNVIKKFDEINILGVDAQGEHNTLIRNGQEKEARAALIRSITQWANTVLKKYEQLDYDYAGLDQITLKFK